MNAYELADQVQMWGEDLLALNMKGGVPVTKGAELIRQQADRIAELEKEAALQRLSDFTQEANRTTPQTKPLTDEEIKKLWNKKVCEIHMTASELEFARAIEAKIRGEA